MEQKALGQPQGHSNQPGTRRKSMQEEAVYKSIAMVDGEVVTKEYAKLESAQGDARRKSLAGATNVTVEKHIGEAAEIICSYLNGKAMKAKGGRTIEAIIAPFGQRPSSLRTKVLIMLAKSINEDVLSEDLEEHLYGESNKSSSSALTMVFKGLNAAIVTNDLKFHITKGKKNDKVVYSLKDGRGPRAIKSSSVAS